MYLQNVLFHFLMMSIIPEQKEEEGGKNQTQEFGDKEFFFFPFARVMLFFLCSGNESFIKEKINKMGSISRKF